MQLPLIDLAPSLDDRDADDVARRIDAACREHGFFLVTGHGVDPRLVERLDHLARDFFARPVEEKAAIAMALGGVAWRGWFPVGGELTSGTPDRKEGIYFGSEAPTTGRPLEGPNLFPMEPASWRSTLLEYLDALTVLGQRLVASIERGLDVEPGALTGLTADPLVLFRIFHYPPGESGWGVGEHTDYGLLTILRQDDAGGLQVQVGGEWIDVPPMPDVFVCNIGDMLERATSGATGRRRTACGTSPIATASPCRSSSTRAGPHECRRSSTARRRRPDDGTTPTRTCSTARTAST